jgi:hypothetical protein
MTTWTAKNYLISETQNSGNREEKTIRFSTESNNLVFIFSKAINYIYNMSMAVAEPKKGILEQILTLPVENLNLVDVPQGLPIELEAQAWLNATKGILDFWDNDEDAAYDDL